MRKESIVLLFLFSCHIGHALKCHTCIGDCTQMNPQDCGPNQQCITKEKRTDGKIQFQQKSCADASECNAASPDPSLTQTCCSTDFCNGAATTSSPTTTSSAAAGSGGSGIREPGTSLTCYNCTDYTCVIENAVNCKPDELCLIKYAVVAGFHLKKRGCGDSSICSKQTTETIMLTSTTVENKCCNFSLCNFAITLKFPLIAIFGAVLFLWIIKLY